MSRCSASTTRRTARERTEKDAEVIDTLQDRLYAEGKRALLVVLQGTDTSGKDGTIRGVFNTAGPLGVTVTPFRRPSEEELAHDFLWRAHLAAPRRGFIGIFNRSHYEDVLIGRVRKLAPTADIEARYGQINAFEKILVENGTTILKFMLHISKAGTGRAAQRTARRAQEHSGSSIPAISTTASCGPSISRPMRSCCSAARPRTRHGTSSPPITNGRATLAIARIVRTTLETMNPQYPRPPWNPKSFKIS